MFKLPDSPNEVIRYVLLFLPGFLVLGLVTHVTGLQISDFAFTYCAVALSIFIYLLAQGMLALLGLGVRTIVRKRLPPALEAERVAAGQTDANGASKPPPIGPFLASVTLIAITLGFSIIDSIESERLLSLVKKVAPFDLAKLSADEPLVYLLRYESRHRIHELDQRPRRLILSEQAQNGECKVASYAMYARVRIAEDTYEGRIKFYNADRGAQGLPFLLAPACRVTARKDGPELYEVVPGPGVLVFSGQLKLLELKEMQASACWRLFNPVPIDPCPCASTCR